MNRSRRMNRSKRVNLSRNRSRRVRLRGGAGDPPRMGAEWKGGHDDPDKWMRANDVFDIVNPAYHTLAHDKKWDFIAENFQPWSTKKNKNRRKRGHQGIRN